MLRIKLHIEVHEGNKQKHRLCFNTGLLLHLAQYVRICTEYSKQNDGIFRCTVKPVNQDT